MSKPIIPVTEREAAVTLWSCHPALRGLPSLPASSAPVFRRPALPGLIRARRARSARGGRDRAERAHGVARAARSRSPRQTRTALVLNRRGGRDPRETGEIGPNGRMESPAPPDHARPITPAQAMEGDGGGTQSPRQARSAGDGRDRAERAHRVAHAARSHPPGRRTTAEVLSRRGGRDPRDMGEMGPHGRTESPMPPDHARPITPARSRPPDHARPITPARAMEGDGGGTQSPRRARSARDGRDPAERAHGAARAARSRPSGRRSSGAGGQSPRRDRVAIARSASRRSCRSRSACRLSYSRLPLATASSTFALPSLKYRDSGTRV